MYATVHLYKHSWATMCKSASEVMLQAGERFEAESPDVTPQ